MVIFFLQNLFIFSISKSKLTEEEFVFWRPVFRLTYCMKTPLADEVFYFFEGKYFWRLLNSEWLNEATLNLNKTCWQ